MLVRHRGARGDGPRGDVLARRGHASWSHPGMAAKRKLIEPTKGAKRYVRRSTGGQFTADQTDVGRSLAQDRRRRAKAESTPGQGDKGDRRRRVPLRAARNKRR